MRGLTYVSLALPTAVRRGRYDPALVPLNARHGFLIIFAMCKVTKIKNVIDGMTKMRSLWTGKGHSKLQVEFYHHLRESFKPRFRKSVVGCRRAPAKSEPTDLLE